MGTNHALSARNEMEILTSGFIQIAESNGVELKYLKEMTTEKDKNGSRQFCGNLEMHRSPKPL